VNVEATVSPFAGFDAAGDVILAALPCGVERDRLKRLLDRHALIRRRWLVSGLMP
jgi:hypothetical protein